MPGIQIDASQKGVGKIKDFAKKRGYCNPVVLSDSNGCMTLLAGAATYEACLEEKETKIPAVIVQTAGEADNLMFALQSAQLNEVPNAIAIGAAIVQLIDSFQIPRKHICEALGKSPAWINRMESLSRKLNSGVQKMVAQGQIQSRSAQEIARLPDSVQMPFAVSANHEFLSKENITYLVNRYLNEDTGAEERDRIIYTPKVALPNERKNRSCRDNSDSARLARALARCLDDAESLSRLLPRIDPEETVIRTADIIALAESLLVLQEHLEDIFTQVKKCNRDKGTTR
jgi:ParB-like chromosome segregation protein Spo0J